MRAPDYAALWTTAVKPPVDADTRPTSGPSIDLTYLTPAMPWTPLESNGGWLRHVTWAQVFPLPPRSEAAAPVSGVGR